MGAGMQHNDRPVRMAVAVGLLLVLPSVLAAGAAIAWLFVQGLLVLPKWAFGAVLIALVWAHGSAKNQ